jgi:hypothetical protein
MKPNTHQGKSRGKEFTMTPNPNQTNPYPHPPYSDNPDDYESDPEFSGPSDCDRWHEMANKGDVRGLLSEVSHSISARISMDALCRCVHFAIEKLARDDPTAFVRFLEADMMVMVGKMVIRAQTLLDKELRHQADDYGVFSIKPDFDKLAEKVMALNVEVAKLLHINASTQLTIERARKLKLSNDKVEKQRNRPARPRRQRLARPQPVAPNSRIGGDLP